MIPPTLQELIQINDPLNITAQQRLALMLAWGMHFSQVTKDETWQQLINMKLVDADRKITALGKMKLSEVLNKKDLIKRKIKQSNG